MPNDTAIRKRSQIAKANRTMFLWIAAASALVGVAVVVSIFYAQRLFYTEKVLSAKQNTVSVLSRNLDVVDGLKDEVQALSANQALLSIRANETDSTLQVVLDALPSDANSLALGASLQNKLLAGIEGSYTLESLQVTPVDGVESLSLDTTVDASSSALSNEIGFNFTARGSQAALQQALRNLERSIRTIQVKHISIETRQNELSMSVQGVAYYEPAQTIEFKEKAVPR